MHQLQVVRCTKQLNNCNWLIAIQPAMAGHGRPPLQLEGNALVVSWRRGQPKRGNLPQMPPPHLVFEMLKKPCICMCQDVNFPLTIDGCLPPPSMLACGLCDNYPGGAARQVHPPLPPIHRSLSAIALSSSSRSRRRRCLPSRPFPVDVDGTAPMVGRGTQL